MNFNYRQSSNTYRVWLDSWYGDTFEVLTHDEFEALKGFAARFNFTMTACADDDD